MDTDQTSEIRSQSTLTELIVADDAPAPQSSPVSPVPQMKEEESKWGNILLAYKTLGVVMGSLVTSPLYVYSSVPIKSPTEEDFLGLYGIIFWTITLIGVVKYCFVALDADDRGEGGTFALYSLLCRHMDVAILSAKRGGSSSSISSSMNTGNKTTLARFLEGSIVARRLLLFASMLGMCMLIGDSILTPAMSVLSAIEGIRAPFPAVSESMVELISAVVLVVLFLLQRFGTSRVSFLFSPIMGLWTLCIPFIGTYRIIRHYPGIFKALYPLYIIRLFARRGKDGWLMLGGTILCITGTEALFADLGHFNKRSIQTAFLLALYPSLVLTYGGQTAYLIKNPDDIGDAFYKFVPKPVYWPMFVIATLAAIVASQSLISATFSVIKQSVALDYFPRVRVVHTSASKEGEVYCPEINFILMILCTFVLLFFGQGNSIGNAYGVVVTLVMLITTILLTIVMITVWRTHVLLVALFFCVFFVLEGVYVSALMVKIPEGGWLPFLVSLILSFIMFGWFYGRQRKLDYEATHKVGLERLKILLANPGVQRVPGVCLFYTNIQDGFAPLLGHYIKNMKSLHKITIFTTFRYLLVPEVPRNERTLVSKLGLEGVYGCVIRYGYADAANLEKEDLASQVLDSLFLHLQTLSATSGSNYAEIEEEFACLEEAKISGIIHLRGKTRFCVGKKAGWFDRVMLALYEMMHSNCRSALPALGFKSAQQIEIGMLYEE